MPGETMRRVYEAIETFKLPHDLLARQILAAQVFKESIRFEDGRAASSFIDEWAQSQGRILAHLAGVTGSWQLRYVDELSSAFFWVGRLMTLKQDLERDWLFFPLTDLNQAGVSVDDLRRGNVTEGIRRLLWKQTIRAKDAFAQSEQLVLDLPRPYSAAVKRWWIGGLEILNEIRRRDYDVWTEPVALSYFYRMQVHIQSRFGRTTFRSR
jgi:phytoene synthase